MDLAKEIWSKHGPRVGLYGGAVVYDYEMDDYISQGRFEYIGDHYFLRDNYEKAYEFYSKSLKQTYNRRPCDTLDLIFKKARCLYHQGEIEDSIRELLESLCDFKKYPEYYYEEIIHSISVLSKSNGYNDLRFKALNAIRKYDKKIVEDILQDEDINLIKVIISRCDESELNSFIDNAKESGNGKAEILGLKELYKRNTESVSLTDSDIKRLSILGQKLNNFENAINYAVGLCLKREIKDSYIEESTYASLATGLEFIGNLVQAAEMYEKAGMPEKAAEIYEEIEKSKKITQKDDKEESKLEETCPNCGEEIKSHWKKCPECGSPLKKSNCDCGEELKSHWKECPACGKKLI
jgi:tetratricopeptide (TPR) repeat protein